MSQQEQRRRCVLMGFLGCGKTTIFNKLCKEKEMAISSLKSNTLKISESTVKYGKTKFVLVDTPGMGAFDAVFTHSINMVAALTDGPINRILVVIKFDTRLYMIQKQIKEVVQIVKDYSPLITIIINHVDLCKNDKNEFYRECQNMIRQKFQISSVIFTEYKSQAQQLCLAIEQELNQNFKQLEISDTLFNELFIEFVKELEDGKQLFLSQFQQFDNSVKRFLEDFNTETTYQDQILHTLYIFIRQYSLQLQENFEKIYGTLMEEINQRKNDPILAYQYYTVLKYSIKNQVQDLVEKVNQKMKYPLDHPFRKLRKCPHCGVIWFKPIGCDDIYCGKKMKKTEEKEDLRKVKETYRQFKFTYQNKEIQYQEVNLRPNETRQANIQNSIISTKLNDNESQFINSNSRIINPIQRPPQFNDQNNFIKIVKTEQQKLHSNQSQQQPMRYQQNFLQLPRGNNYQPRQQSLGQQLPIRNYNGQQQVFTNLQEFDQNKSSDLRRVPSQFYFYFPTDGLTKEEQEDILQKKQIGCGRRFNWEDAYILSMEELELNHEKLYQFYTAEDLNYKTKFDQVKDSLIQKAIEEKQIL